MGVKRLGLTVYVQKYGIEGPLYRIQGVDDDNGFTLRSATEVVAPSNRIYRIFDRVSVCIEVATASDSGEAELILSLIE